MINHKILVGNIFRKTIGNNNISETIIIKIRYHRCPTPISFSNPRQQAHFTKNRLASFGIYALINLQSIAWILIIIMILLVVLIRQIIISRSHHFLTIIVGRHHINRQNINQTIVIQILNFIAHCRIRSMFKIIFSLVSKSWGRTVPIVNIK